VQSVLDIDLDFFLDEILYATDEPTRRPREQDYQVDSMEMALDFLQTQCGLDEKQPIPGFTCRQHKEVFFHWRRMLRKGTLKAPFEVIHIDAHADMGLGNNSCLYIAEDLLKEPAGRRRVPTGPESWELGDCNFIAYALACRWIGRLTYVTHPRWKDDIQWLHMKDFSTTSGFVQMKRFNPGFADDLSDFRDVKKLPFEAEPDIPLDITPRSEFRLGSRPDFLFISRSPNYTPASADRLFDRMKRFIGSGI
tara:strand:- start:16846 stop:17598 length:753 start_codon:yes stop_codon:yes gene_type:complete